MCDNFPFVLWYKKLTVPRIPMSDDTDFFQMMKMRIRAVRCIPGWVNSSQRLYCATWGWDDVVNFYIATNYGFCDEFWGNLSGEDSQIYWMSEDVMISLTSLPHVWQMNEMYEMITKKQKAQQDAEKALLKGRPSKGMYAYDSDEDTEGRYAKLSLKIISHCVLWLWFHITLWLYPTVSTRTYLLTCISA